MSSLAKQAQAMVSENTTTWVSPRGYLHVNIAAGAPTLPASAQATLTAAFTQSVGLGLLYLGARIWPGLLPVDLAFWQKLGRLFMTQLCLQPELESQRDKLEMPPNITMLHELVDTLPLMQGAEYIDTALLESMWQQMLQAYRQDIRDFEGTVAEYLHSHNPAWHSIGRVCFHLAENKTNIQQPFAFLATYAESLGGSNRPRHLPLGDALRTCLKNQDKAMIARIIEPVRLAAEQIPWVHSLGETQELYAPQAWEAEQAHRFLQDVPVLEASGITVRIPDWWHKRPQPKVAMTVGQVEPSTVGLTALLDFNVELMLGDERLTRAEWQALTRQSASLAQVRGRWVEVDAKRLKEALARFDELQTNHEEGVTFAEGMRLLAGMPNMDANQQTLPADVDWSVTRAGAWLHKCFQEIRHESSWQPPPDLRATLRPYQQVGVKWLLNLRRLGVGACLADDMGLGKTIQILTLLLCIRHEQKPSLLVVPASLLGNWQQEAQRFAPALKIRIAHSSVENPATHADDADVVLTTYGMVGRLPWLQKTVWNMMVVDEAQAIKNPDARQTRAIKAVKARQRIALTGTPVENRAMDLWSIFDFINPGLLGNTRVFGQHIKQFANVTEQGYAPLRRLVRPYILRRLKTDKNIVDDLPDKTEMLVWCGLHKKQVVLYEHNVQELMKRLETANFMERRGLILAYMTRLKQICNHPSQWLDDADYDPAHSGKFKRLAELCGSIVGTQEKLLIFTQYREIIEPLHALLTQLFGKPGLILHGGTPVKMRQAYVRQFQEDDNIAFFVLSLKAGGTGLNLTAASHVIHFDRWWNPAVEKQATDRAFRIGQKRHVLVHKFACRGTLEEKIDAILSSKANLSEEILSGSGEAMLTEMNDQQLMETLCLDIHQATQGD